MPGINQFNHIQSSYKQEKLYKVNDDEGVDRNGTAKVIDGYQASADSDIESQLNKINERLGMGDKDAVKELQKLQIGYTLQEADSGYTIKYSYNGTNYTVTYFAPQTPTETPEQNPDVPAETPEETPADKPADTTTEKPAETIDQFTNLQQNSGLKPLENSWGEELEGSPAADLNDAYDSIYQKDFEETNKDTPPNSISKLGARSMENSEKIITNEADAKAHIQTLINMLVEELKNSGTYSQEIQDVIDKVEEHFRWDLYFIDNPASNATKLEKAYMYALTGLLAPVGTIIGSIYLIEPGEEKNYHQYREYFE